VRGKARGSINKRFQRCEDSERPPLTPKRVRLNSDTLTFDPNNATRETPTLGLNPDIAQPKKSQEVFQRCEDLVPQPSTPKRFELNSDRVVSLDRDWLESEISKETLTFNKAESTKMLDSLPPLEGSFFPEDPRIEAINLVNEIFDEKITPSRKRRAENVPRDNTLRSDIKTESSEAILSDFKSKISSDVLETEDCIRRSMDAAPGQEKTESKISSDVLETEDWIRRGMDPAPDQAKKETRVSSSNEALKQAIENHKKRIKILENQLEENARTHAEAENAIKDLAKALEAETQHSMTRSRTTSLMSIETSAHSLSAQVDDYKLSHHIASLPHSTTSKSMSKQLSKERCNAAKLVLKLTEAYEEIRRLRKIVDDNRSKTESSLSTSEI